MRARRARAGFTLVELMVVVAITSVVAALAARLYSRGTRGETAPAFARNFMSMLLDARHMSMTMGRPVRVTLAPSSSTATPATTITTSMYDTTQSAGTWLDQTKVSLPTSMQFCTPQQGVSTSAPACPMSTASIICFSPNGHVNLPSSGTCDTASSPSAFTGATLYVENKDGGKKYKLWVFGLTGMTKMVDQW